MPGQQKGVRHGGRAKGTRNKNTQLVGELLEKLGCDPLEITARFAMDQVPCTRCGPDVAVKLEDENGTCLSCRGTGLKIIDEKHQVTAATKLLGKLHPDLASKTIDKVTRKVVFGRMNAMSDDEKAEIADVLDVAKDDGTYEES